MRHLGANTQLLIVMITMRVQLMNAMSLLDATTLLCIATKSGMQQDV